MSTLHYTILYYTPIHIIYNIYHSVVIAICKGCTAKHWIADNLDPTLSDTNIEEYFVSQGKKEEQVTRVNGDVYEIERIWGFTTPGEITDDSGETVLE